MQAALPLTLPLGLLAPRPNHGAQAMAAKLLVEQEPNHAYTRTLEVEPDDDGNVVLWEEVEDYAGFHLQRVAIPAARVAALCARLMTAARECAA